MPMLVAFAGVGHDCAYAQDKDAGKDKEERKLGWSNTADLSLVVTGGNSDSVNLGFSDQLNRVWKDSRFEFEVSAIRTYKSDDRFFLVEPGLEFPVGGGPQTPASSLVKPEPTLDVSNYLVRGEYENDLSLRWFWNAGGSWYSNDDAGILNRYVAFAGVGNKWVDNQRRRFATSYGVSHTDREEEESDPEKDRHFIGVRVAWDYTEHFNAGTTFDSDLATNVNLSDSSDHSISTLNAVTVSVTNHVAIKASVQWLFENKPALKTDLDVIAYVELVNPDGMPGTGDERFRTTASGGTKLVLGSADARKEKLDTIIRTALVIKF
jgi:uncharacterized protein DUF481